MVLRRIFFVSLLLALPFNSQAADYILKLATLIPPDTSWTNVIHDWDRELQEKSKGRLKIKLYPGGVMGDEPVVIRKMRTRQLHGGIFTGYGIGRMYSPARVLEMPFLFRNTNESDFVRDQLMPEFEKGFRKNGYELLGWPEVGFIHLFSKKPIESIDDLRTSRIWLWQGDVLAEAFFKAADIAPIPLSIIDVYSQISAIRGNIDTIYAPPFGAIAMQWHTKVKYASNIPFTNGIGGLIVSSSFFDKLPDDLQTLLKKTGREAGQKIADIARRDNEQSLQILKDNGITFTWNWSETEIKEFNRLSDKAAAHLVKIGYFPETVFNRTINLINSYRKKIARETAAPDPQSP